MTLDLQHVAPSTAVRLAKLIRSDGRFVYSYDVANDAEIKDYNILRHAACVWALNEASSAQILPSSFDSSIRQALSWLMRKHLILSAQAGFCLVEDGLIKLGGNALTILAVLSFSEQVKCRPGSSGARFMPSAAPRKRPDLVESLCEHLLAQITPDGDFHHVREHSSNCVTSHRSAYYTGQALFALLKTLHRRPEMTKLRIAHDMLHNLAARDYGVAEQSHWMMYAIEMAHVIKPDSALLHYAEKITDRILDWPQYRNRQRATPIACRSEALLAYLRMLGRHDRANEPNFARIKDEVFSNLLLQVKDYLPDGAFREGADGSTVRIDYLQHNLAAFLGYSQLES